MSEIKIAIAGAGGRMGRQLLAQVLESEGCTLSGGTEPEGSPHIGADLGLLAGRPEPRGIEVSADPLAVFKDADAVIDFTVPEASCEHAALAAQARIVHVIGTTGLSENDNAKIAAAARHATIIKEGNMSLGVNLLGSLVRQVAAALDADWDIEILEMHHKHKVDAPSGTALLLGNAAAKGRGVDLKKVSDLDRHSQKGARKKGDIGFATLRGGSVVGEHSAIFAGEKERLVLSHVAEDRAIFARGAVAAAKWGQGKGPGLFGMADVLGLKEL